MLNRYGNFARALFTIVCAFLFILSVNIFLLWSFLPHFAPYDLRRVSVLLLFLLLSICLLLSVRLQQAWFVYLSSLNKFARLLLVLFVVLGLISSVLAPLPKYALLQFAYCIDLFVIAGIIFALRENFKNFDYAACILLCISVALYVGYSLFCLIKVKL
ncbi:MAG: hypothetical protein AAGA27_04725, partial [Pseudomonadota bacterium]